MVPVQLLQGPSNKLHNYMNPLGIGNTEAMLMRAPHVCSNEADMRAKRDPRALSLGTRRGLHTEGHR